jgi:hypothetical protein
MSDDILRGIYYTRPTARYLTVDRVPVGATCPECRRSDVREYPVFAARGPRIVTKCQACLATLVDREPTDGELHPPFRPMTRSWKGTRAG